MFQHSDINFDLLQKRAFNLRWAAVPNGVIPLTAADPDFPCAPEIAAAISQYAKDRYFSYAPTEGLSIFKEANAQFFHEKRNVKIAPKNILPVDSAAFGIHLICKSFLEKEDEAIIFDPVDFLFRYSVENVGAKAVPFAIPAGNSDIDIAALEELISPKTKMICLCNPLNPTGKVFTKDELTQIGNLACKHHILILSDEIWSDIVFSPNEYISIAAINEEISQQTIIVTGFSKSYGLAGLRIGTVATSNQEYFDKILTTSLYASTIHGCNVLSQLAAATALNECDYWLADFKNHLQKMRDFSVAALNDIDGIDCISPDGCYVTFANIKGLKMNSTEVYELLLNEAKVAVVPGLKQWFGEGAEGYIRICFSTSEIVLTEAFARIKNTINKL